MHNPFSFRFSRSNLENSVLNSPFKSNGKFAPNSPLQRRAAFVRLSVFSIARTRPFHSVSSCVCREGEERECVWGGSIHFEDERSCKRK